MSERKYHELWFLQVAASPYLNKLKTSSAQEIAGLAETSHIDAQSDPFLLNWDALVSNDHTQPFRQDLVEKLNAIHTILQPIQTLLFPQWVMDRFKEALDQYTRGEWLSSISLCGDIVEFIVNDFWDAYGGDLAKKKLTRTKTVRKNLKRLLAGGVLQKDDFDRLFFVRQKRDDNVHDYLKFKFKGDYSERVKSDDIEVLNKLSEFSTKENMVTNYGPYLDFALALLSEVRKSENSSIDFDTAVNASLRRIGKKRCPSCRRIVNLSDQLCDSCGNAFA